jgi:hypothetical protein
VTPKIIHYCLLTGDSMPEAYKQCMYTWQEKLSDYSFIRWDPSVFDVNSIAWTKQAFEAGLFDCASDYIRFYAVYHHGGVYLDMDMEVAKPFDVLLEKTLILGRENNCNDAIEAGCFGAEKEHPFIKTCMEYFEKRLLFEPSRLADILECEESERYDLVNPPALPEIMGNLITSAGFNEKCAVFPYTYFTAHNILTGSIDVTEDTFTIHHFFPCRRSQEWRETQELGQKILDRFDRNSFFVKILVKTITLMQNIEIFFSKNKWRST